MEELLLFLNSIQPLNPNTQDYLIEKLKWIEVPKKNFILKEGHICFNIYFINTGLLRCFYTKEDKEISSWFMREGDVIMLF
jgi:CRP-like cAMP-binding protein